MTRTPMPSPNNTNRAGLYLEPGSRAAVAYDAAPDSDEPMDYTAVLAFLREKLDPDDLTKVARMLGVEVETTGMDRRRAGFRGASDSARRVTPEPVRYDDAAKFPNARRLKS